MQTHRDYVGKAAQKVIDGLVEERDNYRSAVHLARRVIEEGGDPGAIWAALYVNGETASCKEKGT